MEIEKEMKEVFDFYSLAAGDKQKKTVLISQIQEIIDKIGIDISEENIRKFAGSSFSEKVDYPTFVNLFTKDLYEGMLLIYVNTSIDYMKLKQYLLY